MFKVIKLQAQLEALKLENEQLKKSLREAEGRAQQWQNLMTYTGKPQSMEGVRDD